MGRVVREIVMAEVAAGPVPQEGILIDIDVSPCSGELILAQVRD